MPVERGRRGVGTRRAAPALVVVRDPRAIGVLVALVVALAIALNLVLVWHGATGKLVGVRPVFDVVAVLAACAAGDRFGMVRVLGWTTIGALLSITGARLVPVSEVSAGLVVLAEASLVGGVPLCVLVAQDLRWVSRALVTGLVFGLRYWSDYVALFLVRYGFGDVQGGAPAAFDAMVVVIALLVAGAYLMVRAFDRLAPPPSPDPDLDALPREA